MVKLPKPDSIPSTPRVKREKKEKRNTPGEKSIFDALSSLSKAPATHEHHDDFMMEVEGEKSHRSAVILLCANLENALEVALYRVLHAGRAEKVFRSEHSLYSFRNKVEMGYALNLYGNETFGNLERIRKIRNAFAHAKIPITFSTPEVVAACTFLVMPKIRHSTLRVTTISNAGKPYKQFRNVCGVTSQNLMKLNFGGPFLIAQNALKVSMDPAFSEIEARQPPLP